MHIESRRTFGFIFMLFLLAAQLFGCAAQRPPLTGLVPGRTVATLQSSVSLSASSGERSSAGRGYLIYQAPDLYHLLVLSPFGQTILEAFGADGRFTCVIPSRGLAYAGSLAELPAQSSLKSLELFRWVMAPPPVPVPAQPHLTLSEAGTAYYFDEEGMLARKVSPSGDEVRYEGYRSVSGVPFPETIAIRNAAGGDVRIVFDEPQLNAPVEPGTLEPNLSGLAVLPLSEFKAM